MRRGGSRRFEPAAVHEVGEPDPVRHGLPSEAGLAHDRLGTAAVGVLTGSPGRSAPAAWRAAAAQVEEERNRSATWRLQRRRPLVAA